MKFLALPVLVVVGLMPALAEAQPRHYPGPAPRHHHGNGAGAGVAAGIIGLAAGAMIAGAAAQSHNAHVERCLDAYRSYDPDTDTFVDKYGRVRRCNL